MATVKGDTKAATSYTPDTSFDHVTLDDYDLLVVPGGTVNADTLRINESAQKIVQHFADQQNQLPQSVMGHGF